MRVLTTAAEIGDELGRLIRGCSSCRIAVAWASVGFDAFAALARHRKKIERMVVGTHFHQTHPDFIEEFLKHPRVRFVMTPDGVFHPKVYLFKATDGGWSCLIGSPNFTQGGVGANDELAVLVTDEDDGAEESLAGVEEAIEGYWSQAARLDRSDLAAYRAAWRVKQQALRNVQGRFGNPDRDRGDGGRAVLNVPILRQTWQGYYRMLRARSGSDPDNFGIEARLRVIAAVRELFVGHTHFRDLDNRQRRMVAGMADREAVNFLYFGDMRNNGRFQHAIKENNRHLSAALDAIPLTGTVTREDYLRYVEEYERSLPTGGIGIATASRLLAMKRPDMFVCLDGPNREELARAFGIPKSVSFEGYWDSIIGRVTASTWWNSPAPLAGVEREVWQARAAFLDCLFYDGSGG